MAIGTGAAILGGAAISGIAGSRASSKAAKAQQQAADTATMEQRRQFDITQQNQAPWLAAGQNALAQLQNPMESFQQSPGFNWLQQQGTRGLERSAAARGGATSGNALKALAEFNTGLAQQDFGNWWNRQAGLAGVGQASANALGQFGAQTANNIGQLQMAGGEARASGILGQANSLSSAANSGLNNYLLYRGGYFGGPAGGGGSKAAGLFGWNYPNGGFGGGMRGDA